MSRMAELAYLLGGGGATHSRLALLAVDPFLFMVYNTFVLGLVQTVHDGIFALRDMYCADQ
jgi:hypothetical protein